MLFAREWLDTFWNVVCGLLDLISFLFPFLFHLNALGVVRLRIVLFVPSVGFYSGWVSCFSNSEKIIFTRETLWNNKYLSTDPNSRVLTKSNTSPYLVVKKMTPIFGT